MGILAEGAQCESYLDTGNRADFDNAPPTPKPAEDANTIWLARACAPQCRNGTRLDAIRARLAAPPLTKNPPEQKIILAPAGRMFYICSMQPAPPLHAPAPAEPHPAVLLGEAVAGLLACLLAPWGLWRLMPGGRALHAMLTQWGRDFAALMQRLAAAPPIPATPTPVRTRRPQADPRPKSVRAPGHRTTRARAATTPGDSRATPRAIPAFPPPPRAQAVIAFPRPRPPVPWPRAGPPEIQVSRSLTHALLITIS